MSLKLNLTNKINEFNKFPISISINNLPNEILLKDNTLYEYIGKEESNISMSKIDDKRKRVNCYIKNIKRIDDGEYFIIMENVEHGHKYYIKKNISVVNEERTYKSKNIYNKIIIIYSKFHVCNIYNNDKNYISFKKGKYNLYCYKRNNKHKDMINVLYENIKGISIFKGKISSFFTKYKSKKTNDIKKYQKRIISIPKNILINSENPFVLLINDLENFYNSVIYNKINLDISNNDKINENKELIMNNIYKNLYNKFVTLFHDYILMHDSLSNILHPIYYNIQINEMIRMFIVLFNTNELISLLESKLNRSINSINKIDKNKINDLRSNYGIIFDKFGKNEVKLQNFLKKHNIDNKISKIITTNNIWKIVNSIIQYFIEINVYDEYIKDSEKMTKQLLLKLKEILNFEDNLK